MIRSKQYWLLFVASCLGLCGRCAAAESAELQTPQSTLQVFEPSVSQFDTAVRTGRAISGGPAVRTASATGPTMQAGRPERTAGFEFETKSVVEEPMPIYSPAMPVAAQGTEVGVGLGGMLGHGRAASPPVATFDSWNYRPLCFGLAVGMLHGGSLISDWTGQRTGVQGGFRVEWDVSTYWGVGTRYLYATPPLHDSAAAMQAREEAFGEYAPVGTRHSEVSLWDVDLLYYPRGDTRFRPYLMLGMGTSRIIFYDALGTGYDTTAFAMPVALGAKYLWTERVTLRLELADNIVFAGSEDINTQHYFSLLAGIDLRFGGPRRAYWPYNPSRNYW